MFLLHCKQWKRKFATRAKRNVSDDILPVNKSHLFYRVAKNVFLDFGNTINFGLIQIPESLQMERFQPLFFQDLMNLLDTSNATFDCSIIDLHAQTVQDGTNALYSCACATF